jgi:hypothetical protein
MNQSSRLVRVVLCSLLLCSLIWGTAGCAGLTLLAEYAAIASTINSLVHHDDNGGTTYELSGYVYADTMDGRLAIQALPEAPSTGSFAPVQNATVSIDTSPARTQKTNAQGYFHWTGIPDTRLIMTVTVPGGAPVQFDVILNTSPGSITPRTES